MSEAIQEIEELVDSEWLELIMTARSIGLTVEDVRDFLKQPKMSSYISQADGLQE